MLPSRRLSITLGHDEFEARYHRRLCNVVEYVAQHTEGCTSPPRKKTGNTVLEDHLLERCTEFCLTVARNTMPAKVYLLS